MNENINITVTVNMHETINMLFKKVAYKMCENKVCIIRDVLVYSEVYS